MKPIRSCPLCSQLPAIIERDGLWLARCCSFATRCEPMPSERAARGEWNFRATRDQAVRTRARCLPSARTMRAKMRKAAAV